MDCILINSHICSYVVTPKIACYKANSIVRRLTARDFAGRYKNFELEIS